MQCELSRQEIENYWRDGYLFPIRALSPDQALGYRKAFEEAAASLPDADPCSPFLKTNPQYLFPFADDIARDPGLANLAAGLLGPDLMVWSTSFFVKAPGTPAHITWHQDLTYWGLGSIDDEVTLWLALSSVTEESGCMRFIPGSHLWEIVEHRDTFEEDNLLSRGQEIAVEVNEEEAVSVCLEPGEVSLHHGRLAHASGPNRSDDWRIGLAIRYITPAVRQSVGSVDYASLVKGEDRFGHFQAPPRPKGEPDQAAFAKWQELIDETSQYFFVGAEDKSPQHYSERKTSM